MPCKNWSTSGLTIISCMYNFSVLLPAWLLYSCEFDVMPMQESMSIVLLNQSTLDVDSCLSSLLLSVCYHHLINWRVCLLPISQDHLALMMETLGKMPRKVTTVSLVLPLASYLNSPLILFCCLSDCYLRNSFQGLLWSAWRFKEDQETEVLAPGSRTCRKV